MQGLFFRVDGADLETGEDTYLVLQAPTSKHAEQIARRQGLLIASVRPATTQDWGVTSVPAPSEKPVAETIVFQGIHNAAVEIVKPPAELASPPSIDPTPAVESGATSSIFPEAEPELPASPEPSISATSEPDATSGHGAAALDLASWLAARPPAVEESHALENHDLPSIKPAPVDLTPVEAPVPLDGAVIESTPSVDDAIARVDVPFNPGSPDLATNRSKESPLVETGLDSFVRAKAEAKTPAPAAEPSTTAEGFDWISLATSGDPAASSAEPAFAVGPPISPPATPADIAPEPSITVRDEAPLSADFLERAATLPIRDQTATAPAIAPPAPTSAIFGAEVDALELEPAVNSKPKVLVMTGDANSSQNSEPSGSPDATATERPTPLVKPKIALTGAKLPTPAGTAARNPGSIPKTPAPRPISQTGAGAFAPKVPAAKLSSPGAVPRTTAPAPARGTPLTPRPATASRPGVLKPTAKNPTAAGSSTTAASSATPASRPGSLAAVAAASRTTPSPATPAKSSKTVMPPRPLPPVVPVQRPVRLTPPVVKRIPPTIPAAPVIETPSVAAPPANEPLAPPPFEPPPPPEANPIPLAPTPGVELTPIPEPDVPAVVAELPIPPAMFDSMPGMLDLIESSPIVESFHDMGPAADESQRVSGEVVAGSGVNQVVTKIAWDQTAHAVEHSSGSALERLASAATSSYPPEAGFDDPFAAVPAAELAVAPAEPPAAFAEEQFPTAAMEETAVAPIAAAPVRQSASYAASASHQPSSRSNPMLPVFYVLAPFAFLVSGAGIALVIWSMTRVAPADFEDLAKLDFRITALTQTLLGGMTFLGGLLLLVCAALAYVAGALRAQDKR